MLDRVLEFVRSWSEDDAYERFGVLGGRQWLIDELNANPRRNVIVACAGTRIVGLLDHIEGDGAVHIGLVVDAQFRRMHVGTGLVGELVRVKPPGSPVAAECRRSNYAAVALLRRCGFDRVSAGGSEIVWRHE